MSVGADVIARVNEMDAFKVKCKNCQALEIHGVSKLLTNYWCDFWCTTIDNADEAFCSFFTPLPIYNPQEGENKG